MGDTVMIYQKPLIREEPEGEAIISAIGGIYDDHINATVAFINEPDSLYFRAIGLVN